MITTKSVETSNTLANQAAASVDRAIQSTQRVTNEALDSLSNSVHGLRDQAVPAMQRSSEQFTALAQRGMDAVRDTSQELRDRALRASDQTVGYIKGEPVKSMLIAAAAGATLMALLSLMARSRGH